MCKNISLQKHDLRVNVLVRMDGNLIPRCGLNPPLNRVPNRVDTTNIHQQDDTKIRPTKTPRTPCISMGTVETPPRRHRGTTQTETPSKEHNAMQTPSRRHREITKTSPRHHGDTTKTQDCQGNSQS